MFREAPRALRRGDDDRRCRAVFFNSSARTDKGKTAPTLASKSGALRPVAPRSLPVRRLSGISFHISAYEESELSAREYAAIAEYQSAIDIGLRESFGWQSGRKFLDVCHAEEAFPVGGSKRVTLPRGAAQLVAFWPEDYDWTGAGLEPRFY